MEAGLPKLTPDPRFSESRLTGVDTQNLAALDAALSEQKKGSEAYRAARAPSTTALARARLMGCPSFSSTSR